MQVTQKTEQTIAENAGLELQGFAGWLLGLVRGRRGVRHGQQRLMKVVETLPLGGKRQLMLVRCGEKHFLVGGGLESVETIVRVEGGMSIESQDGICL
ncbi:flagellar biosynthesis protein FliO [Edaphobacter aggregans]|uniref:Flagellar biosynthesis protein FliO n=1 Tax=Edaphobacter aggregans TaxID=570835 RepID=A0A3R9QEK2_9BACT|nr:flagellar biosynthetic protein FliO [Edaphobacter aggregans]RSL19464.1 flagellar biosynthesis protein FliO [Edaphobacter aggregans]